MNAAELHLTNQLVGAFKLEARGRRGVCELCFPLSPIEPRKHMFNASWKLTFKNDLSGLNRQGLSLWSTQWKFTSNLHFLDFTTVVVTIVENLLAHITY